MGAAAQVRMRRRVVLLGCLLATAVFAAPTPVLAQQGFEWQSNWSVRRRYSLEIDTSGYELPTAIAFVPQPGPGPKDPLYFVTELRGTIKVITNDRSIFTFAKGFFTLRPVPAVNRSDSVEVGLTGICLEPQRGYVFVTFAYHDVRGFLRNNIARFQSRPGRFSVTPQASVDFREVFVSDQSSVSHQIGPCHIHQGHLYAASGDGGQPNQSRVLDSTLGKILRMTLDGRAPPTIPSSGPRTHPHPPGMSGPQG